MNPAIELHWLKDICHLLCGTFFLHHNYLIISVYIRRQPNTVLKKRKGKKREEQKRKWTITFIKENGIKEMQFLNEELLLWSRRLGKFLGFVVYCGETMKGYGIIILGYSYGHSLTYGYLISPMKMRSLWEGKTYL